MGNTQRSKTIQRFRQHVGMREEELSETQEGVYMFSVTAPTREHSQERQPWIEPKAPSSLSSLSLSLSLSP